jgi:hypothetical protein
MSAEERKGIVKVLWRKSIMEQRTGGKCEMKSYEHRQHKCGKENDLTPDPNGLTAGFKCCERCSEERKRMVKVLWQKSIREQRTGGKVE